jgi:hypothetical protein
MRSQLIYYPQEPVSPKYFAGRDNIVSSDTVPKAHKYFMFIPSSQGVRTDRIIELHKGRVRERTRHLRWENPYGD